MEKKIREYWDSDFMEILPSELRPYLHVPGSDYLISGLWTYVTWFNLNSAIYGLCLFIYKMGIINNSMSQCIKTAIIVPGMHKNLIHSKYYY